MNEDIRIRLGVTDMQIEMAYYSGALPRTIDPEPFILHWESKLNKRRLANKPKTTIYDEHPSYGCCPPVRNKHDT